MSCLTFSWIQLIGNYITVKTQATTFSWRERKQKYFCFSVTLFHPLTIMSCLSFPRIQLEGKNKTRMTKATPFSWRERKQNYFCFSVTLFHPLSHTFCRSCSLFKGYREAIKSIVFTCVFSSNQQEFSLLTFPI